MFNFLRFGEGQCRSQSMSLWRRHWTVANCKVMTGQLAKSRGVRMVELQDEDYALPLLSVSAEESRKLFTSAGHTLPEGMDLSGLIPKGQASIDRKREQQQIKPAGQKVSYQGFCAGFTNAQVKCGILLV